MKLVTGNKAIVLTKGKNNNKKVVLIREVKLSRDRSGFVVKDGEGNKFPVEITKLQKSEGRGGRRKGAGRHNKFSEPSERVFYSVPESKVSEIDFLVNEKLKTYVSAD